MKSCRILPWIIAAGAVVGLVGSIQLAPDKSRPTLAEQWRTRLESLSDEAAAEEVERLARSGDSLSVLLGLLASDKAAIGRSVRRALLDEIERWKALPESEAVAAMHRVAISLDEHVGELPPRGEQIAEELALQMLLWPKQSATPERRTLDDTCEQVLRTLAAQRQARLAATPSGAARRPRPERTSPPIDTDPPLDEQALQAATSLPEGAVEIVPATAPAKRSATARADSPDGTKQAETDNSNSAGAASPDKSTGEPGELPATQARPLSAPAGEAPSSSTSARRARPSQSLSAETRKANPKVAAQSGELEAQTARKLIGKLVDSDGTPSGPIEVELRKLGFTDIELQLARQLASRDATTRSQLAEVLPRVPGIDARTWLVWLAEDGAADVRLAALTVMATSGQSEWLDYVAQAARRDDDRRVQQLGEKLLDLRKSRGRP